jgi:hypothetical protein
MGAPSRFSSGSPNRYHGGGGRADARGPLRVDDDMRARVEGWRRQRMSWADIARNLGRSEPDVRREFDQPRFGAPGSPVTPTPNQGDHP